MFRELKIKLSQIIFYGFNTSQMYCYHLYYKNKQEFSMDRISKNNHFSYLFSHRGVLI